MDYYGLIYCATNKLNNKKYIGQTTKTLEKRIQEHLSHLKSRTQRFYSAIKHYGINNFNWTIIEYATTKSDLDEKEKMWIKVSQSMNSEYGYNMCEGGSFGIINEEARRKISNKIKGKNHYMYGKHPSEETKQKQLLSKIGRKNSEKVKQKMSRSAYNRIPTLSKKVRCIETGIIYNSTREVERLVLIAHTHISKCCKENHRTAGGFHWAYYSD
jgi:group I intron endonuclease